MLLTVLLAAVQPEVRVLGPGRPNAQTPATMVVEPAAMLVVACDGDGDGRTTRIELDACVERSFVKSAPSAGATLGYIGYADWQRTWLGDQGALPSPLEVDRDGDNRITLDELQAQFAKLFARYDKDSDGAVTRAEALTVRATAATGRDKPAPRRAERIPAASRTRRRNLAGKARVTPPRFDFAVHATDGAARTGAIAMRRGVIRTPAFMPVGTAATVKAMKPGDVAAAGADIILGNTYHLMLRPGAERVARLGGVHALMGWTRPILTDSGGYQVMSLAELTKRSEEGVAFKSHLDGTRHLLTPERSIEIQRLLGSDIVMAFDELVPTTSTREVQAAAMQRSMRWATRSRAAFDVGGDHAAGAALFGIQQGALDEGLRKASADALVDIGFDGYAIGGLAVGEGQEAMFACLDFATGQLPADRPRYLMGVGKPTDIVGAVERGVDMFDCVLPTRSGRTGQAFTRVGPLNLRNARFAEDMDPLDAACLCPVCSTWSRAYLHHLVRSGEILGAMLMTEHNIWFYETLMADLRSAIADARLTAFANDFRSRYAGRTGEET